MSADCRTAHRATGDVLNGYLRGVSAEPRRQCIGKACIGLGALFCHHTGHRAPALQLDGNETLLSGARCEPQIFRLAACSALWRGMPDTSCAKLGAACSSAATATTDARFPIIRVTWQIPTARLPDVCGEWRRGCDTDS